MTRAVYVIGGPGTGKTQAMSTLVNRMGGFGPEVHVCRETFANRLAIRSGWVLGRVRENFSGTDACGKAASGWFRRYLEAGGELPELVLGEGERFAYVRFLVALRARTQLTVVHLTTDSTARHARLVTRDGEDGAMTGKAGDRLITRMENLAENLEMLDFEVRTIDTTRLTAATVASRLSEIIFR